MYILKNTVAFSMCACMHARIYIAVTAIISVQRMCMYTY